MIPRGWLLGVLFLAALLFSQATSTYSAIKSRDNDLIKIAFMNGYIAAAQMDPDDLKILKRNPKLMKQTVEEAADKYMATIASMNQ